MKTTERDAEILRTYRAIGDAQKLADKHGLTKMDVLKIIHADQLKRECTRARDYAQAVTKAGEVVYALPAKLLQTGAGAEAIVNALQSAIQASKGDQSVLIAIAVIQVEEVVAKEPLVHPHVIAATLQAKSINKREVCHG